MKQRNLMPSCSAYALTLKMEAIYSLDMLVMPTYLHDVTTHQIVLFILSRLRQILVS
jgi:hypothetical protein